jgi:glycosyltransferase involved in cell wall biosynthesis
MILSVVVTTYNRAEPLGWTLESLSKQTRLPDELIVSDNCSQDDTAEVVASFQNRFPKLVYSRNDENLGMPGNLNAGIQRANGDLIANLHDADTCDPTLLEKWEQALIEYPDAGFVWCGLVNKGADPTRTRVRLHPCDPYTPGREFFEKHFLGNYACMIRGTVMARKEVYETMGFFDPGWGMYSDVEMWMRICSQYGVAYVREPLQICSSDHTSRTMANRTFLNFFAMTARSLEHFYAAGSPEYANAEAKIRKARRKRLTYLAATQVKRLNTRLVCELLYWSFARELDPFQKR